MSNKRLQLAVRNAACTDCRLHRQAEDEDVCVTGDGPNNAKIMVVTKFPTSESSKGRQEIIRYLTEAGIDHKQVMWCSALKCRVWDIDPGKTDMKACRPYLTAEIQHVEPTHILSLGTEPLFATTGKSGIMKYRGKLFTNHTAQVFPTISPNMVARNPGLRAGFIADLMYFKRLTEGTAVAIPHHTPEDRRTYVGSKEALRDTLTALRGSGVVAYDIETVGASEFATDASIVSIAFTTIPNGGSMDDAWVWEVPLFHPESPWKSQWRTVFRWLYRALRDAKKKVAHNAKYDTRWCIQFGAAGKFLSPTFDTIIAAALLDENRPKGLKPLAQQILGADPWGVDTSNLLSMPIGEVLEYNGLDTWHTARLYFVFRKQLTELPKTLRLFQYLMMPTVQDLVHVERRGVYVHQDKLRDNWAKANEELAAIEKQLLEWVPDTTPFPMNFNPSNFLRWWLFEYLKFPVLGRGKRKEDGTEGDPSCAEAIMMTLSELEQSRLDNQGVAMSNGPTVNIPALMLKRTEWFKMGSSFFGPYTEQLDNTSRLHTTFKPWGTVTGRMSSGKEDQEKLTGRRQVRGVNLQQVPRNQLVRGVFGAPPGSSFVEADYSQIELRLAAFLAREPTMLQLYATGQDIHMAMAMRMTGKPASAVTKEERKRAKAVNFGFLYGMGWNKFILTAWTNYELRVSEQEARAFRTAFFTEFKRLPAWHAKQRRMANANGRVETPMGRIRHLPDIYSPDEGVRAEAERQAINSPVQAFASDMALLSMVYVNREFKAMGITGYPIGLVHDAVNYEIPNGQLSIALPIIKDTMENLPLRKLFGINLDVPIIADLKVGDSWGGATEIPANLLTVQSFDDLKEWLKTGGLKV